MALIRGDSGNILEVDADGAVLVATKKDFTFVGAYQANSGNFVVSSSAHNPKSQGFMRLCNPAGSGRIIKIERIRIETQFTSALSAPTAPRIAVSKMTFTGASSSGIVAPVSMDTARPGSFATVSTSITGLAVATVGIITAALPVASQGTAGWATSVPSEFLWLPREDDYECVVREGEGIHLWQADAGTDSDTRKIIADMLWEEVTL